MYQKQTLLFGALVSVFCVPLFAFAQTSTTTTDQPSPTPSLQAIDDILTQAAATTPTQGDLLIDSLSNDLEIKTNPTNPKPKEMVTISIESYLSDLNKASIVWTLNNKVALSGIGEKTYSFQTGDSGETTKLSVAITTSNGLKFTKDFSWTPVGVTVFWQADTYTPPFYKGKPLLSSQASVKVIATPDNIDPKGLLGPGNLVYTWQQDGSIVTKASGYGKNSFTFAGPLPLNYTNVSVRVSSLDDSIHSDTTINPVISDPFVLFYQKHPLMGVLYNQPLGSSITLTEKELSISAEPYFFTEDTSDTSPVRHNWLVNNKKAPNTGRVITLRNDTQTAGTSDVSFTETNIQKIFQAGSQDIRINFTAADSSNKPVF